MSHPIEEGEGDMDGQEPVFRITVLHTRPENTGKVEAHPAKTKIQRVLRLNSEEFERIRDAIMDVFAENEYFHAIDLDPKACTEEDRIAFCVNFSDRLDQRLSGESEIRRKLQEKGDFAAWLLYKLIILKRRDFKQNLIKKQKREEQEELDRKLLIELNTTPPISSPSYSRDVTGTRLELGDIMREFREGEDARFRYPSSTSAASSRSRMSRQVSTDGSLGPTPPMSSMLHPFPPPLRPPVAPEFFPPRTSMHTVPHSIPPINEADISPLPPPVLPPLRTTVTTSWANAPGSTPYNRSPGGTPVIPPAPPYPPTSRSVTTSRSGNNSRSASSSIAKSQAQQPSQPVQSDSLFRSASQSTNKSVALEASSPPTNYRKSSGESTATKRASERLYQGHDHRTASSRSRETTPITITQRESGFAQEFHRRGSEASYGTIRYNRVITREEIWDQRLTAMIWGGGTAVFVVLMSWMVWYYVFVALPMYYSAAKHSYYPQQYDRGF